MSLRAVALALVALLGGCAPSHTDLRERAAAMAAPAGLRERVLRGASFDIYALERIRQPQAAIRVYIEGDGNAWLTRTRPSPDPTPLHPTALELALQDSSPNVVYLARPCQYVRSPACNSRIWTVEQFSEPSVGSMDAALNAYKGHKLELIGYSGGGGVALLLAARRGDVSGIRTVAGNVDSLAFTTHHGVTALQGDNPASFRAQTNRIPQLHYAGGKDKIVPPLLAQGYQSGLPAGNCSRVVLVPAADHTSGWQQQWKTLAEQPLPCQ